MPHHMSSEELLRVKKGDQLFIHGKYYEVVSAGYRWIRCKGLYQPINIGLAHLQSTGIGTGDMHHIYRTETPYNLEQERINKIERVERSLRAITYAQLDQSSALTESLEKVLRQFDLLTPVRK